MDTGKSIEKPQSSWNTIKKSMKMNTKLEYHTLEQLVRWQAGSRKFDHGREFSLPQKRPCENIQTHKQFYRDVEVTSILSTLKALFWALLLLFLCWPGILSDIELPDACRAFWRSLVFFVLASETWSEPGFWSLGFETLFRKCTFRGVSMDFYMTYWAHWLDFTMSKRRQVGQRILAWWELQTVFECFWELVRSKGFWSSTSSRYFSRSFG